MSKFLHKHPTHDTDQQAVAGAAAVAAVDNDDPPDYFECLNWFSNVPQNSLRYPITPHIASNISLIVTGSDYWKLILMDLGLCDKKRISTATIIKF